MRALGRRVELQLGPSPSHRVRLCSRKAHPIHTGKRVCRLEPSQLERTQLLGRRCGRRAVAREKDLLSRLHVVDPDGREPGARRLRVGKQQVVDGNGRRASAPAVLRRKHEVGGKVAKQHRVVGVAHIVKHGPVTHPDRKQLVLGVVSNRVQWVLEHNGSQRARHVGIKRDKGKRLDVNDGHRDCRVWVGRRLVQQRHHLVVFRRNPKRHVGHRNTPHHILSHRMERVPSERQRV